MNPGLRRLLWCDWVGRARALTSRLRTPRGLVGALGVLFFLIVLASARLATWLSPESASPILLRQEGVRSYGPLVLLAFVGMSFLSGRGLYFKPAEIGFLFAAPVTRRDLVAYNVLARARLAALSAVWMALVVDVGGSYWPAVLLGAFQALLFVQITSQFCAVGSTWLAQRVPNSRGRSALFGFAVLLVVTTGLRALAASSGGLSASAHAALEGPVMRALTLPARPALEVMLAGNLQSALAWSAVSTAVLWLLFEGIARFDVDYAETAFSRSREMRRARAASRGASISRPPRRRPGLPRFPRLGGAGPLAWRQCLELKRNPRGVISVLLVMSVTIAFAVLTPAMGEGARVELAARLGLLVVVLMSLVLTQNLAFDFRRDLDRMPVLKTFPISTAALAVGQMVAATAFTTGLQLVGLGLIAFATGVFSWPALIALALPLPALSWAAVAIDNAIFLTWPYRVVPEDPGDMGFMGRNMAITSLKVTLVSLLAVGAALGSGAVVKALGGSVLWVGAGAAALLGLACIPMTLVVARAFRRLDVSLDVPA